MDDKLTGLKVNTNYGVSKYGDGRDDNLGLAWGTAFADGRGHFVVAAEYERNQGVGDCYTRPWCSEERQALTTPANRPAGVPAQLLAYNVHTSTQTEGGLITSGPFKGTQFGPDGTPYAFNYGQYPGTLFQIGGSGKGENAYIQDVYIEVPVERYTAYSHGSLEFTDNISGFVETNFAYVDGQNLGGDRRDSGSLTITTQNPFPPACRARSAPTTWRIPLHRSRPSSSVAIRRISGRRMATTPPRLIAPSRA
jgi:iron complex outermembrane receptor protein